MERNQILSQLQDIFNTVFLDDVKVSPELSAGDVDEWDSLTHITLVVAVEKAFQVKFRTGEVEATRNVGEFADLIQRRIGEK